MTKWNEYRAGRRETLGSLVPFFAAAGAALVFEPDNTFIYRDDSEKLQAAFGPILAKHHIPDTLKDQVFWGYKPADGKADVFLHRRSVIYAGLVHDLMTQADYFEMRAEPTDHAYLPLEMGFSGIHILPQHVRSDVLALRDYIQNAAQQLQAQDAPTRFSITKEFLTNSFRSMLYKVDSSESNFPQTLGQFLTNNSGGCEDFAVGRYMLARALGVPANEAMVVMYRNRLDRNGIGHANLALYDRTQGEWHIIDGTGRTLKQRMGASISFTNTQEAYNALRDHDITDMPALAPVIGINDNGVIIFRTLGGYEPPSHFSFHEPLPLFAARTGVEQHVVFNPPEARPSILGRLFARRPT